MTAKQPSASPHKRDLKHNVNPSDRPLYVCSATCTGVKLNAPLHVKGILQYLQFSASDHLWLLEGSTAMVKHSFILLQGENSSLIKWKSEDPSDTMGVSSTTSLEPLYVGEMFPFFPFHVFTFARPAQERQNADWDVLVAAAYVSTSKGGVK